MAKSKKSMGVQQCLIGADRATTAILEYLCSESNKLHNCSVYYARQMWFKANKIVTGFDLINEMRSSRNRHFQSFNSDAAAQTCISVGEAVKAFIELLKKFHKGEVEQKPRFPGYRRSGYQVVTYPARRLKLVDGQIKFPLGVQVKAWFGIDAFYLPMPTNLNWKQIREVRILPRNGCFYAEFVYPVEPQRAQVDPAKVLGIDHGINNWLTCVSNVGTSFIVDGRHVKSLNQWYNKRVAALKEGKPQGFWSKQLASITEKRNRQMRDAVNKAARLVINHCLSHGIGRIVFGWNPGQKDGVNMGRVQNQKFVQIPTAKLKARIAQLCEQYGIEFIEQEEANTSAASFLDGDSLPKHGEKPEGWQSSGKRVKRGLFRTGKSWYINADCNGAANVMAKVAAMLGLDLSGVSRGVLTAPVRVRLWTTPESPSL